MIIFIKNKKFRITFKIIIIILFIIMTHFKTFITNLKTILIMTIIKNYTYLIMNFLILII